MVFLSLLLFSPRTALIALRGIRPEEAAAFGDGENDLGMLKSVTHGYAMGSKNSPGEIPVWKTPQRPARSAF